MRIFTQITHIYLFAPDLYFQKFLRNWGTIYWSAAAALYTPHSTPAK